MGFGSSYSLTFETLRLANINRLPQFKNKHGGLAHSTEDGSDWSPSQWLQAVVGELGEYANERKKFERGDLTLAEFKEKAGKELADVQTYLDILARRCLDDPSIGYVDPNGIDLGRATIAKFNEVSERVGSSVFIYPDGQGWGYGKTDDKFGNDKVDVVEKFNWDQPPPLAQMLLAKENRAISPTHTLYATVLPPCSPFTECPDSG